MSFKENTPWWVKLIFGFLSLIVFLYAIAGLLVNKIVVPGRVSSLDFYDESAIFMAGALFALAARLMFPVFGFKSAPKINSFSSCISKLPKYTCLSLFALALIFRLFINKG